MCPFWAFITKNTFLALSQYFCFWNVYIAICWLNSFWRHPFHLDLTFALFQLGFWVPGATCTSWHPMRGTAQLSCTWKCSFASSPSTKHSNKRVVLCWSFYMWTWEAYNLISVFLQCLATSKMINCKACSLRRISQRELPNFIMTNI